MGDDALGAYLDVATAVAGPGPRDLRVVYTPLHGVGLDVFLALWERAGFPPPIVVDQQAKPDPDFPTAPFPNPEEPGVLDLALDLATRHARGPAHRERSRRRPPRGRGAARWWVEGTDR